LQGKYLYPLIPTSRPRAEVDDAKLKEFLLSGNARFRFHDEVMAGVVRNTTSQLTPADRSALMAYLRALPPLPEEPR
jgi:hypothetical protein